MKIEYTCPKCGGDLQELILTSMPPQRKLNCINCNWSYTYPREQLEEVIKVPFPETREINIT